MTTGAEEAPDSASFLPDRARALKNLGRGEEAFSAFRDSVFQDPIDAPALKEWKDLSMALGKEVEYYESWSQKIPCLGDWVRLASALARRDSPESRVEYWTAAKGRFPKNAWVLACLAEALSDSGRVEDAIQELEQSLLIDPLPRAGAKLFALVRSSRSAGETVGYFKARLKAATDGFEARWALAGAIALAGDWNGSEEEFLRCLCARPEDALFYRLNRFLTPLLPPGGAVKLWEEASRRFPDSDAPKRLLQAEKESRKRPRAIRINAGGKAMHDEKDRHWEGDSYFVGGIPARGVLPHVSGPLEPILYWSERRTFPGDPDRLYAVGVPNGDYVVSIHVRRERECRPPFEVKIEEEAAAWPSQGEGEQATIIQKEVSVRDGFVDIDVLPLLDDGRLSAIEIVPKASGGAISLDDEVDVPREATCPGALKRLGDRRRDKGDARGAIEAYRTAQRLDPEGFPDYWSRAYGALLRDGASLEARKSFLEEEAKNCGQRRELEDVKDLEGARQRGEAAIRINAGGEELVDHEGRRWLADRFFVGGASKKSPFKIEGTADQEIYRNYREDDGKMTRLSYAIPVPPGRYSVTLHFAESDPKQVESAEGLYAFSFLWPDSLRSASWFHVLVEGIRSCPVTLAFQPMSLRFPAPSPEGPWPA